MLLPVKNLILKSLFSWFYIFLDGFVALDLCKPQVTCLSCWRCSNNFLLTLLGFTPPQPGKLILALYCINISILLHFISCIFSWYNSGCHLAFPAHLKLSLKSVGLGVCTKCKFSLYWHFKVIVLKSSLSPYSRKTPIEVKSNLALFWQSTWGKQMWHGSSNNN